MFNCGSSSIESNVGWFTTYHSSSIDFDFSWFVTVSSNSCCKMFVYIENLVLATSFVARSVTTSSSACNLIMNNEMI